jgi:hypothetical protein
VSARYSIPDGAKYTERSMPTSVAASNAGDTNARRFSRVSARNVPAALSHASEVASGRSNPVR